MMQQTCCVFNKKYVKNRLKILNQDITTCQFPNFLNNYSNHVMTEMKNLFSSACKSQIRV